MVGDLTQAQQDNVTAMLRASVGDIDQEAAEAMIAQYVATHDETYLGWSGGTMIDDGETYIRVDGPAAWIKHSNQSGRNGGGDHQHTILCDQTADYGG